MSLVVKLESSLEVNGKTSEFMGLMEAHFYIITTYKSIHDTLALLTLESRILEGNT